MLVDSFQRSFEYLRLSVTDRCNFRCSYCLPNGYKASSCAPRPELSVDEIRRLVSGFAHAGFTKVRVTGGEPTLRSDIVEIIATIAQQKEIRKIAMTTNGFRLNSLLPDLKKAGLTAINISLDSLTASNFAYITGSRRFESILSSIEQALSLGFEAVKLNVVLLKGINDHELKSFLEFVRVHPISLRFIELMKTGDNQEYFARHHVPVDFIRSQLQQRGWEELERRGLHSPTSGTTDGPAAVFVHSHYAGQMGLIAPYAKNFCDSCNRLRVSSQGRIRMCLFGQGDFDLRPLLQDDVSAQRIPTVLDQLIINKKSSHQLLEGIYGTTANFAEIGG